MNSVGQIHKKTNLPLRDKTRPRSQSNGFTIVELLLVIVVIGILATIVAAAYNGAQRRAWVTTLTSDLQNAADQLVIDESKTGSFPATTSDADGGDGLVASNGTTYQYTPNNAARPHTFCLTGTNNHIDYKVTETGPPVPGVCPGHVASSPDGGGTVTCDSGFILVPGSSTYGTSDFCVAKYEAKDNGSGKAVSQANGLPWVSISQVDAMTAASGACSGCHLITDAQWLTIAQNIVGVASNWSGGAVGSGYIYGGHSNNSPPNALAASSSDSDGYNGTGDVSGSQRRTLTLSNGQVIWDFVGNVWEWTTGQTTGGQPGLSGETTPSWKEWNAVNVTGSLSPNPFPAYGVPAASGWTSAQGMGKLYSNVSDTALRGFRRGDYWYNSGNAGLYSLNLSNSPYSAFNFVGFRVAK